ncbi:unnamed protein product, partial [Cuscuta europaea]
MSYFPISGTLAAGASPPTHTSAQQLTLDTSPTTSTQTDIPLSLLPKPTPPQIITYQRR